MREFIGVLFVTTLDIGKKNIVEVNIKLFINLVEENRDIANMCSKQSVMSDV